jgi:hypothetical protein
MSRFGWAYVNDVITGSAAAGGPTNSVQFNSGSGVFSGSSNFMFNPTTNTVTLLGTLSGSSLIISASAISASAYYGVSGSGGGTPGGADTYLQYNSGSTFAGKSNLTFNYTTNTLRLTGTMNAESFTGSVSGAVGYFDTIVLGRTSTSSSITLNSTNHIVAVNTATATASVVLSLPNGTGLPSGKHYVIKDEGGNANNRNIILSCSVFGQTIDGAGALTINSPYAALNVYCDGAGKYFIY